MGKFQLDSVPAISRRRFLRAAGASLLLAAGLPAHSAPTTAPTTIPAGRMRIEGGLVRLPAKGRLYIANDFHTRVRDFDRWLKNTDLVAKLKSDENIYGLVLGDVLDIKPNDPEAVPHGDSRMIEKIREIQRGPGGDRLIYVLGNHEFEVINMYHALRTQVGMTDASRDRIWQAAIRSELSAFFLQYNFLQHIALDEFNYLRTLPLAVICDTGLVAVHAGPADEAEGPQDLAQCKAEVVKNTVWRRPLIPPDEGYEAKHIDVFLKRMDNSGLMIAGHTPLVYLDNKEWMAPRDGLVALGEHAVVMAASYGALRNQKRYLSIDLSKRYGGVADLKADQEIISNEPAIDPNAAADPGVFNANAHPHESHFASAKPTASDFTQRRIPASLIRELA